MNILNVLNILANKIELIISLVALIISIMAFYYSRLRPSLDLYYSTHQAFDEKLYKNADGKITLSVNKETINDDFMPVLVSESVPMTSISLELRNSGKVSAKHPAIIMRFNGIALYKPFDKTWQPFYHRHAIGGYEGVSWVGDSDTLIYPEIPLVFERLSFSNAEIDLTGDKSIDITIIADGCKVKRFKIPVEIE